MKILLTVTYISTDGAFGGPVSVAMSQAAAMTRAGHDVTLVAGWDSRAAVHLPGVEVVLLPSRKLFGAGFVLTRTPRLSRWLRSNLQRFDVIHVHGGRHAFDIAVARAAQRSRRPYFVQTHGMILPSSRVAVKAVDQLGVLRMLRSAESVLALTEAETAALKHLDEGLLVKPVRNGIDSVGIRNQTRDDEVLFLARLHERKRVMTFAEMARLVHETHGKTRFTVVGPDEGELPALREFIADHPHVPLSYEGTISPGAGPERLARATMYILPSVGEVFPMTVLEALSVETPTILTADCGIAPELRRSDAALISDGSASDLARKVRVLLESPERREEIAKNGLRTIGSSYSADAVASSLIELYAGATRRAGVLWMTNTSAPYRVPVWNALAESLPLEVMLLESDRRLARDSNNRGADWAVASQANAGFGVTHLKTAVVRRGEARYYLGWVKRSLMRTRTAVVLGGWESLVYWSALLQAKREGLRTVGFYESHRLSQAYRSGTIAFLRGWFFRSLDAVVTPGPASTEALLDLGVERSRIWQGFNAVDVAAIRAKVMQAPKVPRDKAGLRLVYVGQLIARKNVSDLIEALVDFPDASLTIVGIGEQRRDLEELVSQKGIDVHRVRFIGYVHGEDIPDLLLEHDALVLPSKSEVWGLVVNEALACGLHVIVSSRAGVARSVAHHPGVVICEPTPAGITSALHRLGSAERVPLPPIWKETPERFAGVFLDAISGQHQTRPSK